MTIFNVKLRIVGQRFLERESVIDAILCFYKSGFFLSFAALTRMSSIDKVKRVIIKISLDYIQ